MNAGHVNVIARAVAFVVMTMPPKMKKVQLVDQPVVLEQFQRAVDGHARYFGIDLLSLLQNFGRVHMANRRFNYLNHDAALTRETNVPGAQLALKLAGRFLNVDAFARGDAVRRGRRHVDAQYSKVRRRGRLGAFGLLVNLDDSQDVAVHHQREEAEYEDEAHLNEALLERDAQIAAERSFDCQQQHVPAI